MSFPRTRESRRPRGPSDRSVYAPNAGQPARARGLLDPRVREDNRLARLFSYGLGSRGTIETANGPRSAIELRPGSRPSGRNRTSISVLAMQPFSSPPANAYILFGAHDARTRGTTAVRDRRRCAGGGERPKHTLGPPGETDDFTTGVFKFRLANKPRGNAGEQRFRWVPGRNAESLSQGTRSPRRTSLPGRFHGTIDSRAGFEPATPW
jgi:hypothetical protein